MLLILVLLFIIIGVMIFRRQPYFISLGQAQKSKTIYSNQQRFYIEEVEFSDYQQAIHGYFNIVPELQKYAAVLEVEYDFFDFYSVALRFEDCTMRLLRLVNKVRLIKSSQPISIDEFEQAIQPFAYREI